METPQDALRRAIAESPLTPTEIGRKLGYKHPYQAIHLLLSGKRQFTRKKQEEIAEILGKPRDYFAAPDKTEKRMQWIEAEWQKFLQTEMASKLSKDDLKVLERVGRQFLGDKLPTVAFFQHVALVLEGNYTTEQLESALKKNTRLDERLAAKNTSGTQRGSGPVRPQED
jgi:hypothetical protein